MTQAQFSGDKKTGKWAFAHLERGMVNWLVPKVPSWLETYHLTMPTLVWSIGIVVASLLQPAKVCIGCGWFRGSSLCST